MYYGRVNTNCLMFFVRRPLVVWSTSALWRQFTVGFAIWSISLFCSVFLSLQYFNYDFSIFCDCSIFMVIVTFFVISSFFVYICFVAWRFSKGFLCLTLCTLGHAPKCLLAPPTFPFFVLYICQGRSYASIGGLVTL